MFKKLKWMILLLVLSALESHATFSVPDRPPEISSRISSPTSRPIFAYFALFVVSSSSDLPNTSVNDSSSYLCVARRSPDIRTFRPLTFDSSSEDGHFVLQCQSTEPQTHNGATRVGDFDASLTNDGYWAFEWNGENRLIAATPITPTNGAKKVEFAYDYQGRRVGKSVSEWDTDDWSLTTDHRFVYDGWLMVSETINDQTSTITNWYAYGMDLSGSLQGAGGVGGLIAVIDGRTNPQGEPYFPCFDANGNVCQYIDDEGTVVAAREYSSFGETTSATGSMQDDFTFWFSTKYWDTETGLGYWGMRYYHPEQGRWLSRYPLGEEGGLLLYSVCGNNMINGVDPVGLEFVLDPNMAVEDREHWRRIIGRFRSTYHGEKMFLHLHFYTKEKIYIYFTKVKPGEDAKALAGFDDYERHAIFLPTVSTFEDFAHETQHKAEQLCPSKSLDPLDEGLVSEFDPPEEEMPYDTSENRADRFANIVTHEYNSYTPDFKSSGDLRPLYVKPRTEAPIPHSTELRVMPEPYGTKYEGYKYRVGSDEMLMFIEKLQIKRDEIRAKARAARAAGKEK